MVSYGTIHVLYLIYVTRRSLVRNAQVVQTQKLTIRRRRDRRLFHESFNEKTTHEFKGPQVKATRNLIESLFNGSDDIWELLRRYV